MTDEKLKKELEKAYRESAAQFTRDIERLKKAIPAIRKKDYSSLVKIFKSLENKSFVLPDREQLEKIPAKDLEASIQLLFFDIRPHDMIDKSKFIMIKSTAISAAYYIKTDLDNTDCITLTVIKFQKTGKKWQCDNMIYSHSFQKKSTQTEKEAILKEIETNPEFKL